jgi:hypothetical protein
MWTPPPSQKKDRDRHNLERVINCALLRITTKETHKFMGKLENSRMMFL